LAFYFFFFFAVKYFFINLCFYYHFLLVKIKKWHKFAFFWCGVDFFAIAKKDQGSVGRRPQMVFRIDLAVCCQHCPGRFTATPSLVQGIESKCGFNNLIVKSAKDKLLKSIVRDAKKMGQALRFVWC